MTPEETLEAAERVRRIVEKEPDVVLDSNAMADFLRRIREGDCSGFGPPLGPGILPGCGCPSLVCEGGLACPHRIGIT